MFYINKNVDYLSIINMQEYIQSNLLQEFTHILGFDEYIFEEYFDILLTFLSLLKIIYIYSFKNL